MWDAVATRAEALLVESVQWTGGKQRLTATRLHALLVAEGHRVDVTAVKDAVVETIPPVAGRVTVQPTPTGRVAR